MKINLKNLSIAGAIFVFVSVSMVIVSHISSAYADDAPSKAVLRIVEHIKENQGILDATREAHMQFMGAKESNIFDIGQLRAMCYEYDWQNDIPKKIAGCQPEALFQ